MTSDTIRENFLKFLSCSLISPYEYFQDIFPPNHFNSLQEPLPADCDHHEGFWILFSHCFLLLQYSCLSAQFFSTQIIPPASSQCFLLILLGGLLTVNPFWSVTTAFSYMMLFPPSLYRASESSFLWSFYAKGF